MTSSVSIDLPCDEALLRLSRALSRSGLRVMRTFDLHDARLGLEDCPCPHHGTSACDCQMIVALVYGGSCGPATVTLHGNDGQTWLSLADTPSHRADPSLWASIERALRENP